MRVIFRAIINIFVIFSLCQSDIVLYDTTSTSNPNSTALHSNVKHLKEHTETLTTIFELADFPPDCSQRQNEKSLYKHKNSRLKKCCPIGEILTMYEEYQSGSLCGPANIQLTPNFLNVTLYDNCIEDMETEFTLPLEIGIPCNASILYNDVDDLFFIVQDGSLLVMDLYANDTYVLYNNYCVDISDTSGITYAIVCITSVEDHIKHSQTVLVAILMLISIPCLLMVAYFHLRIKQLKSLHGMILSCMSASLAIGYFLYSFVHIFTLDETNIGYAVQFFVLAYYFLYLSLCCNTTVNIWIHVPTNRNKSKLITGFYFGFFCIMSFIGAVVFVILTYQKGLPGMPSYFLQGYTESIRESQRYFIPPVSTLLLLSFCIMIAAFLGFQRLKAHGAIVDKNGSSTNNHNYDENILEEVKKDAKYISMLGIMLSTTWLLELVTFYVPGAQIYVILMDMLSGLQGVFVLLIFLVMRRRRLIVLRWWNDRGSLSIDEIELNLI